MSFEPLLPVHSKEQDISTDCKFKFQSGGREFLLPQLSVQLKRELIAADRKVWQRIWIVQWGKQKVVSPFLAIVRRGLEPKLLSLSAALGLTFGLFPVCGIALIFCVIAAAALQSRCHVPTLMLANFVVSPFQLGLVVPFMRVGEVVMGGEHLSISSSGLWEAIRGHEPRALMFGMLHAVIGWSVFAPVAVTVLYVCFLPVFNYLNARFGATPIFEQIVPVNEHVDIKCDNGSSNPGSG